MSKTLEDASRPVRLYLNVDGGEAFSDHAMVLDVDLARLERLRALAEAHELADVSIRPDYELKPYSAFPALPTDGLIGPLFVQAFKDHAAYGEFAEPYEPDAFELRLDCERLRITPTVGCYVEAVNKYGDQPHTVEAFDLDALAEYLASAAA